MNRPSERVTFEGSQGDLLAARLDVPGGPPVAWALFAHCFTCSKDLPAVGQIAGALTAAGIALMRFDFTGLGSSEGEFANTGFASNLEDLRRAADWLRNNRSAPQLLIGHSLGGAAMLAVAGDIAESRAVVTIGAPADTEELTSLFEADLPTIAERGCAMVSIGDHRVPISQQMVEDLAGQAVEQHTAELGRALLVVHSPVDNIVGVENAARIFAAARHPKSFIAVDGADHVLSNPADATFVGQMIATWANRYIQNEHPLLSPPNATAPVVVAETGQGPYLNHVVSGSHRFLADEPESVGGFDAGPSPYDLLSAALGACTSMTLRMYANRKDLPLDRVIVEVTHEKRHADDCESCIDGAGPKIGHFDRRLRLEGDLDDAQRASLARIADRCPVHRTLESSSRITTVVAPVESS